MDTRSFTTALAVQTNVAAVESVLSILRNPPGDAPEERYKGLSEWYNLLADKDREMLREIVKETAEQAVFNFLTVLDGVSAVENSPLKGDLLLYFVKDGNSALLNDPNGEELHNLFTEIVSCQPSAESPIGLDPYEVGPAADLRIKSRIGDGVDVHHVPRKHVGVQSIENYDPAMAPAIALPKGEHRLVSRNSMA
jgi:hypothetical protein